MRTPCGTIRADRALIATNAYAHAIPALRRHIFTVYAHIIVTRPLTAPQWERVGWRRRMGVEDKRIYPHFYRPILDGRILWGGRDAPFSAGEPNPRWDQNTRVFRRLEETFRWTFPQLADVAIDHGWAGPVCGCINCLASAGFLGPRPAAGVRARYAGHGVGQSYLVGKLVSELLLDRPSDLMDLPMVTKAPTPLPPGLLRRGVLQLSGRARQRSDDRGKASPLARLAPCAPCSK